MRKSVLWMLVVGVVLAGAVVGNGMYLYHLHSSLKSLEKDVHDSDVLIVGYMYLYKITQYRADHGGYPATLQALSPTYISQRYIDQYMQYWSYVPDLEADTFELNEVVEPGGNPSIYSPDFYGIYSKGCVEYALKKRADEAQGQDKPCEPVSD